MSSSSLLDPDLWLRSMFSAKAVGRGGVVHRAIRDVDRYAGRDRLIGEVQRRGFTMVENGEYFVIFCNREPVRLVVRRDTPSLSERAMPADRAEDASRRLRCL